MYGWLSDLFKGKNYYSGVLDRDLRSIDDRLGKLSDYYLSDLRSVRKELKRMHSRRMALWEFTDTLFGQNMQMLFRLFVVGVVLSKVSEVLNLLILITVFLYFRYFWKLLYFIYSGLVNWFLRPRPNLSNIDMFRRRELVLRTFNLYIVLSAMITIALLVPLHGLFGSILAPFLAGTGILELNFVWLQCKVGIYFWSIMVILQHIVLHKIIITKDGVVQSPEKQASLSSLVQKYNGYLNDSLRQCTLVQLGHTGIIDYLRSMRSAIGQGYQDRVLFYRSEISRILIQLDDALFKYRRRYYPEEIIDGRHDLLSNYSALDYVVASPPNRRSVVTKMSDYDSLNLHRNANAFEDNDEFYRYVSGRIERHLRVLNMTPEVLNSGIRNCFVGWNSVRTAGRKTVLFVRFLQLALILPMVYFFMLPGLGYAGIAQAMFYVDTLVEIFPFLSFLRNNFIYEETESIAINYLTYVVTQGEQIIPGSLKSSAVYSQAYLSHPDAKFDILSSDLFDPKSRKPFIVLVDTDLITHAKDPANDNFFDMTFGPEKDSNYKAIHRFMHRWFDRARTFYNPYVNHRPRPDDEELVEYIYYEDYEEDDEKDDEEEEEPVEFIVSKRLVDENLKENSKKMRELVERWRRENDGKSGLLLTLRSNVRELQNEWYYASGRSPSAGRWPRDVI